MDIERIIRDLKQKEQNYHRQKGQLDQLMKQLNEAGFDFIEDAEEWVEDTRAEIQKKQALRDKKFREFEAKFGDLL